MRVLPMGPLAMLVDEVDDPAGWASSFRSARVDGVVDVVPAARTVLVVTENERSLAAARSVVDDIVVDVGSGASAGATSIEVIYDGPDLAEVAEATGLRVDEVVEMHAGATYRVEFCGFAPGFAYLSGLPPELHLPRRSTPRTRVPAGSVAIASEYAAVYPTASPGGWHLLGSTRAIMFDVDRDPPALLLPGMTVRFVPT